MARITLPAGANPVAIAHFAGSNRKKLVLEADQTLEVPDVTQTALDAAFADYQANQAQRDADFQVVLDGETVGALQQAYDNNEVLQAAVHALREELNVLRALHSLPDIPEGQMNGKVHQKIANP